MRGCPKSLSCASRTCPQAARPPSIRRTPPGLNSPEPGALRTPTRASGRSRCRAPAQPRGTRRAQLGAYLDNVAADPFSKTLDGHRGAGDEDRTRALGSGRSQAALDNPQCVAGPGTRDNRPVHRPNEPGVSVETVSERTAAASGRPAAVSRSPAMPMVGPRTRRTHVRGRCPTCPRS